ncbi:MAG: choice-of-anchor J domain-containing protein [Chloroflexota bacterium]
MKRATKILIGLLSLTLVLLILVQPQSPFTETRQQNRQNGRSSTTPNFLQPDQPDISFMVGEPSEPTTTIALRDAPLIDPNEIYLDREINPRLSLNPTINLVEPEGGIVGGVDPLLATQASVSLAAPAAFLTPLLSFDAQGNSGVQPPDTVGEIGPNHYVQMINSGGGTSVTIYDKSGTLVNGPTFLDALGSGNCGDGLGDPVVLYDELADRWLFSEFSDSGNDLCVYISHTNDPTGNFHAYSFVAPNFPDYPKYGVWADAYYVSSNETGNPPVYALERDKMLLGQPATFQRFTAPSLNGFGFQALTPADLDGETGPPANEPGIFMRHRDDESHNGGSANPSNDFLEIWELDVDWDTPGNSTFSQVANLAMAEIDSNLCGLVSFSCISQPSGGTPLDPLRELIMFRLQYRNFGTHETLVGNLATDVDNTDHSGIRWFELRRTGGSWSLYQEGTFAPDSENRWMGSAAMDGSGNIAIGYSISSTSMSPSIRYTGRLASDPLGTLPQGEGILATGSGRQSGERWGDYSSLSVDPVDDCTFWYTTEYVNNNSWQTRIGVFKFDQCGEPDFTIAVTPNSQAVCAGTSADFTVDIGQVSGFTDNVSLVATGEPPSSSTSFSANPVMPPGTSTLTVNTTAGTTPGLAFIEVLGSSGGKAHSDMVSLTVNTPLTAVPTLTSPANNATEVGLQPTFVWTAVSGATGYDIDIATDSSFNNIIHSATDIATTSYSLPNSLDPLTIYHWRVRAKNGCGAGSYSSTFSFTTADITDALACNVQPIAFEEGLPTSWSVTDESSGGNGIVWTTSDDAACGIGNETNGSGIAACADSDAAGSGAPGYDTSLVTNSFSLESVTNTTLDVAAYYVDVGDSDRFQLQISSGGGSWTDLVDWNSNHAPEDISVSLNSHLGQEDVQVRFRYSSISGWDWYAQVDDVELNCTCAAPTAVSAAEIAPFETNKVKLTWDESNNATNYEIHRVPSDAYYPPDGSTKIATTTGLEWVDDNGLDSNYTYVVLAQNLCGSTASTFNRVGTFSFDVVPGS